MIEAIKEIGEYALIKEGKQLDNPVDIIVEDPASSPTYKHVLAIILNKTDEGFGFGGIRQEEYTKEKIGKYLYKQGSSRGADFTPTARITDDIEKTFNNKIVNWFKKTLTNKNVNLLEVDVDFIKHLKQCIEQNKDEILFELKSKHFAGNEKGILTLIINCDGEKYVGDIPLFRDILKNDFATELHYSRTYKIHSISQDQICSICKQDSDEVYGLVSTFKFYNIDKPGFVSGGFNREDAWKNYPVCLNCALKLEYGKKYLKDFLDYKFYGFKYYLIPKLLQSGANTEIFKLLEEFHNEVEDKIIKINKKYDNLLSETEDDALDILASKRDFLCNNLLFYVKKNSEFKILLYVEDIFPSRLRKLFDSKQIVDNKSIFKYNTKDGESLHFTFGNIWYFFPTNREKNPSKYFLEITNKIFVDRKIDYQFLMSAIIRKIRKDFSNDDSTKKSTFLGFQLLDYLNNLSLLGNYEGGIEMDETNIDDIFSRNDTQLDEKVNKLFSEFPDFFGEPAKKAVFLEGGLAQLLLNIQFNERGAKPFKTKLHGLKLDENLAKRLLPEMQNKLEEYNKNHYYWELEALISKYMLQAGDGWNISKDDISFYFVIGMNLFYLFKSNPNYDNENSEGGINE